jgi:RIO kinase 3
VNVSLKLVHTTEIVLLYLNPQGMKKMYTKCRLIHADLSEYNMLWHDGSIYFIDVSQAVEPSHPQGLEFLFRDCNNVYNFFSKTKLVDDVMTPQQLFNYVTGLGIHADSDQEFLIHVSSSERIVGSHDF